MELKAPTADLVLEDGLVQMAGSRLGNVYLLGGTRDGRPVQWLGVVVYTFDMLPAGDLTYRLAHFDPSRSKFLFNITDLAQRGIHATTEGPDGEDTG